MIDGFRYGFFGQSDQPVWISLIAMVIATLLLSLLAIRMLASGYKLRDA